MGIVEAKDVVAVWLDPSNELICADCMRDDDFDKVTEVVEQNEVDESWDFYFCDRCNKRIK